MERRGISKSAKVLLVSFLATFFWAAQNANAQICSSPLTAIQRGQVKFHPGHYVATGSYQAYRVTLDEIASMPNVVGIQKRYTWADLQGPGPNDFKFEGLKNDIKLAAAKNKKLSVMIMWKYYALGRISPVPAYIKNLTNKPVDYKLGGDGTGSQAQGYLAAFDNPVVVTEFVKFLKVLRQVIDQNNTVANVVFPETALSVTNGAFDEAFGIDVNADQEEKIKDLYVDGLLRLTRQASCAFKHTPVIQLTNFPIKRLGDLTSSYKSWGVGMGGPDVWYKDDGVERPDLSWDKRAYDFYPSLQGEVPIGIIVASGNYRYPNHYPETLRDPEAREPYSLVSLYGWNPNRVIYELAKKATRQLQANYIFWKKEGTYGNDYYKAFKSHVSTIGKAESASIDATSKACPRSYGGNCVKYLNP